jgi:hypothetical protein
MSDTTSTVAATHAGGRQHDEDHLQLERKMTQAVEEGHDADIPSSAGYVLDKEGELKRLQSIDDQRRRQSAATIHQPDHDIEKGREVGQTASGDDDENDPNVVWWDGDDDPENPYNWSTARKWLNTGCVSFSTFISPLASCTLK